MNLNCVKILKKLFPLFIFALMITSCTKEDIDEPAGQADPNVVAEVSQRNELGGFGSIEGFEDCDCYGPFDDIDWNNGDPAEIEAQIIAALESLSEEELEALFTPVCTETDFYPNACFAECVGVTDYDVCDDYDWGCDGDDLDIIDCYELVFPVTGVFSDGTTVTFADYDEYFEALINAQEEPQLVYPFDVIDQDGNVTTVNTEEEWTSLGVDCFGLGGGVFDINVGNPKGDECFIYQYPLSLNVDGVVVVFQDESALGEWLENLFLNNPDPSTIVIEQAYPVTVLHFETNVTYTANNEQELFDLYTEHCE